MQTRFGHMQINVGAEHISFYADLMGFLGWSTIHADESMVGVSDGNQTSLWFTSSTPSTVNDHDGYGMNHLAIQTETQADVDTAAAWLKERGIEHLFETPRHRPDFAWEEGQTYYQVMFETPDRLLIEIVYIGPKQS